MNDHNARIEAELLQVQRTLAMLVATAGGRVEITKEVAEGAGWVGLRLSMTPDVATGSYIIELTEQKPGQ